MSLSIRSPAVSLSSFANGRFEQLFGPGFFRAMNVNFGLDGWHEACGHDLPGYFELLAHDALMPAGLACLMTERILVPKMRFVFALSSSAARSGIGFINWTPSFSAVSPLSTFKNGTTRFAFQRKSAAADLQFRGP